MLERQGTAAERLELQVRGVFDEQDARHLLEILGRLAPRMRVRVHFHEARHVEDYVVAMLARQLAGPSARDIELVGLSQHHLRMLRYVTTAP